MRERQGVAALAAAHGIEPVLVAGQLGQRGQALHRDHAGHRRARAADLAAPCRQIAGDIAHGALRRADLHRDDGLQHQGARLAHRGHQGLASGSDKGHLLAVHRVVLAVKHRHSQVHQGMARDHAGRTGLAYAFLDRGHELARDHPALDRVHELEARPACQGLHTQPDLAELPGTTTLLLVAVVTLGHGRDGLAVGNARRLGVDLDAVGLPQSLQQQAQVQLAQAVDQGLVGGRHLLDPEAGVLVHQAVQDFPESLLVAMPGRADGQAMHRDGKVQRCQMDVCILGVVVQHGIKVQLLDLGDGAELAGQGLLDLHMFLALQPQEMADAKGLARMAHQQLGILAQSALMHAQHAHLAQIGVGHDLEHMGQHMGLGLGQGLQGQGFGTFAAQELRRVALAWMGQQALDDVQQFGHAGAALGRGKADGDQMPLAKGLLQRRMQFARVHIALAEVALHKGRVHLHHLLHQGLVGQAHRAEVAGAHDIEEAVQHAAGALGGQVQGQAFAAKGFAQLGQQAGQVHAGGVDLVDHDQAVQAALGGHLHHARGHQLDTVLRIDHDHGRVHRFERRQGLAHEVGRAGRVDQVQSQARMLHMQHAALQRVLKLFLQRVKVADGVAPLHAAGAVQHAAALQQSLGQAGLAGAGRPHQGQAADRGDPGVDGAGALRIRHGALLRQRSGPQRRACAPWRQ